MQCEQIEQRLGAFLDRELPPQETERVRAHLLTCGRCQQALRELQSVDAFLSEWEDEPLPASLELSLSKIGRKPNRWLQLARNVSLAASVAAAFYLGVLVSSDATSLSSNDTTLAFGEQSFYSLYAEAGQ